MKLLCKIILLPTKEANKGDGHIWKEDIVAGKLSLTYPSTMSMNYDYKPQHLYLCSSSEIKEGDWCFEIHNGKSNAINPVKYIDDNGNTWYLRQLNMNSTANSKTCKKIEATTNRSLLHSVGDDIRGDAYNAKYQLPNIPFDFIEKYISSNGDIKECYIEMENIQTTNMKNYNYAGNHKSNLQYETIPKLSKEGAVIVVPEEKKMYSREEHIEGMIALYDIIEDLKLTMSKEEIREWLKVNVRHN